MGVSIGFEFAIELAAAFGSAVIGHAIEARFRRKSLRQGGEATHQVDADILAPRLPQRREHLFENAARTALHQKDVCGLRLAASEKIAHSFEYNVWDMLQLVHRAEASFARLGKQRSMPHRC